MLKSLLSDQTTRRFLLTLFKPYRTKIILIILCVFASSGVAFFIPLLSQKVIDTGLLKQNYYAVVKYTLLSFGLLGLQQLMDLFEVRQLSYVNSMMCYDLNKTVFKHLMKVKVDFLHRSSPAQVVNNVRVDAANITRISDRNTFLLLSLVFRLIGGTIGLLWINPTLAIFVLCIVPIKYLLTRFLAKKRTDLMEKYISSESNYASWLGDTIDGIREIKLFGLNRIKLGQFIKLQREIATVNIKSQLIDNVNLMSESFLVAITTAVLYLYGADLVFHNNLTVGGLLAFVTYSNYVTSPVSLLLNIGYSFSGIIPSTKRMMELLNEAAECDKKGTTNDLLNKLPCNITFDQVSFAYPEGQQVLNNVSFSIGAGEKIAIVGPNGSGKSTIINLLLRFNEPTKGKILCNGIDINLIRLREYRKLFSVVTQRVHLFNTSIRNNITLYRKTFEVDLFRASELSQAFNFIENFSDQFEHLVGQDGVMLSGGQRQKIAMARALVKGFNMLILDEATSNYDLSSERMLEKLLGVNFSGKTILMITHRPDLIKRMDKLIYINEGRVVDIGKHDELILRNPAFRELIKKGVQATPLAMNIR